MEFSALKSILNTALRLLCPLALVFCHKAMAGSEHMQSHPGYLSSVEGERYRVAKEVVIIPPQNGDQGVSLHDQIFDDKLTREFKRRYEDRFGRTQAEQFVDASVVSVRFYADERQPETNRTLEETQDEQRKFGSFMIKRLTEYHVDNYMKTNPSARPIYELKEKASNLNVTVREGYKLRFKYSLSSGDTDIYLKNPYNLENRISFRSGGETALVLGYPVTKRLTIRSDYIFENNNATLSGIRRLGGNWSSSLTGVTNDTEDRILLGFSWSG